MRTNDVDALRRYAARAAAAEVRHRSEGRRDARELADAMVAALLLGEFDLVFEALRTERGRATD